MRGHGPGGAMAMLKALDLTDAQREKVADIHERTARKVVQMQADLRIAQMDLGKLLRGDQPDAGAVGAQIDRVAGLRAAIQKAHVGALLEVRGLLTPAQQKKARELHQGGPGPGRGMGMGRGMGFGLDDPGEGEGEDEGVEG